MKDPPSESAFCRRKLNVLALPSYTAIIFALIALVILGAGLSSLLPGAQTWWLPIVLGVTFLPLRDFLQWPDRLLRAYHIQWQDRKAASSLASGVASTPDTGPNGPSGSPNSTDEMRQNMEQELTALDLTPTPEVRITEAPVIVESFGTFRRRYIAIGRLQAQKLARNLRSETKRQPHLAILCHELAHFANKDMRLMGLSRSLLKMAALAMLVNIWIGLVLVAFLVTVASEALQPAFWTHLGRGLASLAPGLPTLDLTWALDTLRSQNPSAFERLLDPAQRDALWLSSSFYLLGACLPFILAGLVLWIFYWPRLMRVRELYADARTADTMREKDSLVAALQIWYPLLGFGRQPTRWQRFQDWVRQAPAKIPLLGPQLTEHPSTPRREHCLDEPVAIFGSWREIGITVGVAMVLLDLATRGVLTAAYIYEPGPYLPIIGTFLVLAAWFLPHICTAGWPPEKTCQGAAADESETDTGVSLQMGGRRRTLPAQIASIVLVVTAIKLAMHLLDLGIVAMMQATDSAGWGRVLDIWVCGMIGAGSGPWPALMGTALSWTQFANIHVLRPMLYFGLVMPPLLFAFLWADAALKRRVVTWYSLGDAIRRVFWVITGGLAATMAFIVIPVCNHLVFPEVYPSWTPRSLAGLLLGAAVAVGVGIWYWRQDRRWAGKCPECQSGAPVVGWYFPGKSCPSGGHQLHRWLVARY